jgi:hypothetical protein
MKEDEESILSRLVNNSGLNISETNDRSPSEETTDKHQEDTVAKITEFGLEIETENDGQHPSGETGTNGFNGEQQPNIPGT